MTVDDRQPDGSTVSNRANRDPEKATVKRGAKGHFTAGTKPGPGNPQVRKLASYRDAFAKAVTPEDITTAARKLAELAKAGDIMAIRELLDRAIGRPAIVPHGAAFEIPSMETSADVVKALGAIVRAVAAGTLAPEQAASVANIVEMQRRAIETHSLAEEVAELRRLIDDKIPNKKATG